MKRSTKTIQDRKRKAVLKRQISMSEPKHIYISFKSRTCTEKVLRLTYKVFRILYVSFWYYFVPFMMIVLSYWVPYSLADVEDKE